MPSLSDTIFTVAPYFKPYVDLIKLTGEMYYFRKASTSLLDTEGNKRIWHPKIEHTMLREFHNANEGILYMALPKSANLNSLKPNELLYIGCSASGGARFWRGKANATTRFSKPKSCFHHEQMRRGRDGQNLESYLRNTGPIRIHTITDTDIEAITLKHGIQLPSADYMAHMLEKKILMDGFTKWAWNKRT